MSYRIEFRLVPEDLRPSRVTAIHLHVGSVGASASSRQLSTQYRKILFSVVARLVNTSRLSGSNVNERIGDLALIENAGSAKQMA
jgi:hypothetical protein